MEKFQMLTPLECQKARNEVMDLQSSWISRHKSAPFFTLGLASYIDCFPNHQTHMKEAIEFSGDYFVKDKIIHNNEFLDNHFGWLYYSVMRKLVNRLGVSTITMIDRRGRVASPGFHIFLPHPMFSKPIASIHKDTQFNLIFTEDELKDSEVFSFTLSVVSPKNSGLNHWPKAKNIEEAKNSKPDFIEYEAGDMVIHSGMDIHQMRVNASESPRITMQGHILKQGSKALLYW
jgi:hypothetical protein